MTLKPGNVDSDGVAGHTCSGLTAAGAIELATHGNWKGTWSKSLRGYFISAVDGLALPSGTTPTWKEQFGRVIIEALWCGVPVVGSDSGEIPWVIGLTGGGLTFPEGDVQSLAARLEELREAPELRRSLAAAGRAAVERRFTVAAATDPLERLLRGAAARR